ncbi:MAG: hypothetical protein HC908_06290 [Calothrix sp. SM1_7_51]|nr:hypothetical protein [Calothrix sp. SM1_7_51]
MAQEHTSKLSFFQKEKKVQNREETAGIVFDMSSSSLKERKLSDCISIFAFEQGYILNRDGSIAVGFEASLFEEDSLDGGGFMSTINAFALAFKRLPIGTVIQKMDVYHEEDFSIFISKDFRLSFVCI